MSAGRSKPAGGRITAAWIAVILIYGGVVSQILRNAHAAIAPDLMRDVGFAAQSLGLLTGSFFVALAIMQIPVGLLFDRFGARAIISGLFGLAALGCVLFAVSDTLAGLVAARVMMAVGISGAIIGAFFVLANWYEAERYPRMTALQIGAGQIGVLLAMTPFAALAEWIGWRDAYLVLAGLSAVTVLVVFAFLRDAPSGGPDPTAPRESLTQALRGLVTVVTDRRFPPMFAMCFVAMPSMIAVLTLLGGPYLFDRYGLGTIDRANVLFAMGLAVMVAPMVYGQVTRWISPRWVIRAGAAYSVVVLGALAVWPSPSLWVTIALLVLLGASGSYVVMVFTTGRAIFPEHLAGRVLTALNVAQMSGMAVLQFVAGGIVGAFPSDGGGAPEIAYRAAFAGLALFVAVAGLFFLRLKAADAAPADAKP